MYLSPSSHMTTSPMMKNVVRTARLLPIFVTAGIVFNTTPAHAQKGTVPKLQKSAGVVVIAQQISTSKNAASLHLELSDGRALDVAVQSGQAYLNGKPVGDAPRGGTLDHSFRSLLSNVTDSPSGAMPRLLADWSPDASGAGAVLDRALENAVRGMAVDNNVAGGSRVAPAAPGAQGALDAQDAPESEPALNADGTPASDTVNRLNERINELERMVDETGDDNNASAHINTRGAFRHRGPLQSLWSGIGSIVSTLILYALLFALAFGVIAFGGRKYIEGVAETARKMTMRSWLVGLAGTFLVFPAFILGIIALAISIVGIPVLLAWVPLFPLAVIASLALGFLAVAHAAGESLSDRKFYENDYFQRGNSYYFLLTGLGLLLAPFIGAAVIEMAGAWLGIIRGLLLFLGVVVTWFAFTIGFGAVLVSRAGTRPLGRMPVMDTTFTDDLDV